MAMETLPEWMTNLDDEDVGFIRKFILASGSLKEVANLYRVTYPTVRLRLDRLIQKIQISEDSANEPFVSLVKKMAIDGKLGFDTAKTLIAAYKRNTGGQSGNRMPQKVEAETEVQRLEPSKIDDETFSREDN